MADSPMRILLIDDSPEDRAETRRLLLCGAERPYLFIEADTGARGLARYREAAADSPIHCVVLDHSLPDMDALDVLAALTGPDGSTECPVVMLTGSVRREDARAFVRAGAQDYLGKSWMTEQILPHAIDNAVARWTMAVELRRSEERLIRAQRAAEIGTWDWDITTGKASWTQEAWRLFGRSPVSGPVDYDFWLSSLHVDDRERAAATVTSALQTGRYHDEFRIAGPDGVDRWLEARGEILYDRSGRASRMLGTVQDVSARKLAADALREREQRLHLALRASHTGVWTWNVHSGSVEWSEEAYAIAGQEVRDAKLSFADFQQLVVPEDLPTVQAAVQRALDGAEYHSEFRIRRADGAVRHVTNLGLVERDPSGAAVAMIGTITDVTEQRAAATKLKERERELQSIADNTPDILARFDQNLRHVFVSAAITRATGMDPAAMLGKSNRELGMPDELCDLWEEKLSYVFESGHGTSYEFEFDAQSGTRCYSARLVPERDAQGAIHSVLCVSHDVTELRSALRALREADRLKDMFLATLAHELRNPLAPITTGIELLSLPREHPAQLRTLAMMQRQVTQMVRLIDDLMDVSRIASGKVTILREQICLQDVVSLAVETARSAVTRGKHDLQIELPSEPIWVDGDPTRLTQVLGNLITNAAKYTPDSGRIRVSLGRDAAHAVVAVQDSGLGIPPEMINRIFDMFTQVNHTLERSQGGLGIGLALVKHLVDMHGGSVYAHSEGPQRGSTFSVRLPLVTPVSVDASQPGHRPKAKPEVCRILVVDDNVDAAESLAQMLSVLGSDVRIAFGGAEALRVAAAFDPKIVFLDIGMPEMNGYDAARRFREDPLLARVTLVAVTGWGNEEHRLRSKKAGFDHHYTKPVAVEAVRELLMGSSATWVS